jgi:hypothetical protein
MILEVRNDMNYLGKTISEGHNRREGTINIIAGDLCRNPGDITDENLSRLYLAICAEQLRRSDDADYAAAYPEDNYDTATEHSEVISAYQGKAFPCRWNSSNKKDGE